MTDAEQPPGRMRRFVGRVAPGVESLSRYRVAWLPGDIAAGLSVAAVALPVGIAYADIAGVPAVIGMYSAIFPLFAYALFGSSRQLMTGPDAATCMLMAAALAPLAGGDTERYLALVTAMTLGAGIIYLLAGTARLGFIALSVAADPGRLHERDRSAHHRRSDRQAIRLFGPGPGLPRQAGRARRTPAHGPSADAAPGARLAGRAAGTAPFRAAAAGGLGSGRRRHRTDRSDWMASAGVSKTE